jgi:hypothetical protein
MVRRHRLPPARLSAARLRARPEQVKKVLAEAAAALGAPVRVAGFVRIKCGDTVAAAAAAAPPA